MPLDLNRGTSFDYLDHHARDTPERIAITGPAGDISWSRFRADAVRVAQALATIGVGAGRIVAISHSDRYLHWLLVIACEDLGAVSASFETSAEDAGQITDLADIILTQERITDLLAQAGSAGGYRRHPATLDAPLRIVRTSGSTGTPKCMTISRRIQNCWITAMGTYNSLGAATRFYVAYSLSVNPSYYRLETCLRLGATVIFGASSQDLITYRATHCWLLPRDMTTLLQGATGRWPSAQPLHMILGGGPVSAELHDQTATLFGTKVQIVYAANETGFIALQDRGGIGTLLPEVDLLVVDQDGLPVAAGIPGIVTVRSPGLVEGYLNDPDATAAFFRQGRFFTDDAGLLLPDGKVRILGRRSEILNLGGVKVTPAPFEEEIRAKVAGLRDVAVTSMTNEQGIEEICIALVPEGSTDPSLLFERIRAIFPPRIGKLWLVSLDKLPVGAGGKLQRAALKDIFLAARRSS